MSDLKYLLDVAAGDISEIPDMSEVTRRSRPYVWRRRAAATSIAVLVVAGAWAGTRLNPFDTALPPAEQEQEVVTALEPGPLAPGTYSPTAFRVPLTFDIAYPRWAVTADDPTWIQLLLNNTANVHIQIWSDVYDPRSDRSKPKTLRTLPTDLGSWLANHPRLKVISRETLEIGGVTATRVDVKAATSLGDTPSECGYRPCVLLGRVAGVGEPVELQVGQRGRFYIFDRGLEQVVLTFRTFDGFAQLAAEVDTLAHSLEIDR